LVPGQKLRAGAVPLSIETDGTVCIPLLPVGSVGNVRIGASGYESASIDVFNRQDIADQVVSIVIPLTRQKTRSPQFSVAELKDAGPHVEVWCPSVFETRYAWPSWRRLRADAQGLYTVDKLPESIEVFGVAVRDGRIVRYLSLANSKLELIKPASMRVNYNVDGVPVVGGLVHLKRRTAAGESQPCSNLSVFSGIGMTAPSGEVVLGGLCAGTYDLELHEHYCVAEDWSSYGLALDRGGQVAHTVHVRRGSEVVGRVVDSEGQATQGGVVQLYSDETRVYDQYFPLIDGRFTLLGIDPTKAYKIRYIADESLSSRVQYGGPEDWTELRLPISGLRELKARK